jgi:DNA-binding IclR family transcriptional regulator
MAKNLACVKKMKLYSVNAHSDLWVGFSQGCRRQALRKRVKTEGHDEEASSGSALARGLEILRAFRSGDNTLGNQDLIERTGLPKATISRLTATLVQLGYLRYDAGLGRYSIGAATVSLGYATLSSIPVVRISQPILQDLADETGVATALGTRDGLDMIYLANCRAVGPVSLQLNVGSRLPIWRSAMGLAYLAGMEASKRGQIEARLIAASPETAALIHDRIAEASASYAAKGYVGSFGTWYSYINAVGVAFRPEDGAPMVALTCGGIVDIISQAHCESYIKDRLLHAAMRLRVTLETGVDPGP